jgi:hypothetical protein
MNFFKTNQPVGFKTTTTVLTRAIRHSRRAHMVFSEGVEGSQSTDRENPRTLAPPRHP